MNEFYKVLRGIRNDTGLSQKDFAAKIGMKPVAYNMVESGKNQPSYILLNTIISVFKIDANRFFDKSIINDTSRNSENKKVYTVVKIIGEAEFLNMAQERAKRINDLYQRLIDIKALLFQELNIKVGFPTQVEADLLWALARPLTNTINDESTVSYAYENLDSDGKALYLKNTDECITLFTNTFFEHFRQFYNGMVIPYDASMRKRFLIERAKITDQWKYTHYTK